MAPLGDRQSAIGNRQSLRGVTLIEIVISIFVLSIGVIGIISLFPAGYRLSRSAVDRSVTTLAAADAVARIMAESHSTALPTWKPDTLTELQFATSEPLSAVRECDRVGTISEVTNATQVKVIVCGDAVPHSTGANAPYSAAPKAHYWPTLAAVSGNYYYMVMLSGTCAGQVFKITGYAAASGTITVDSANYPDNLVFRCGLTPQGGPVTKGAPVRVGDSFALIGSVYGAATNLICYPRSPSFLTGSGVVPIATEGDPSKPWQYSYGAIISAPSSEMRRVCRVDVFVYRGFVPSAAVQLQARPAGHVVTYVPREADYQNPGQ